MTDAEWLFEFEALKRKEKMEVEAQVELFKVSAKTLRETLVHVLGLHLFVPKATPTTDDDGSTLFMPAVFLLGNHHLLSAHFKEKEKEADAEAAMNDEAFEAFSAKLAAGDYSDLAPIHVEGPDSYWNTAMGKAALEKLGVRPRAADAPPAPYLGAVGANVAIPGQIELEPGVFVEE
jgi:hypothetical protein